MYWIAFKDGFKQAWRDFFMPIRLIRSFIHRLLHNHEDVLVGTSSYEPACHTIGRHYECTVCGRSKVEYFGDYVPRVLREEACIIIPSVEHRFGLIKGDKAYQSVYDAEYERLNRRFKKKR